LAISNLTVTFHPQTDEFEYEEVSDPFKIGFFVSIAITFILLVGLVLYKYQKKKLSTTTSFMEGPEMKKNHYKLRIHKRKPYFETNVLFE